jgi:hypothetical protein
VDIDPVAMADADPIPVLMQWLQQNAIFNEVVGDASHVSGALRAPYPHIILSQSPGGRPSDGVHFDYPEIRLDAVASPEGLPGKAELLRVLKVTAVLLSAYPDEGIVSDRCSINDVQITSPYIFGADLRSGNTPGSDGTGGQIRWYTTLSISSHAVSRR